MTSSRPYLLRAFYEWILDNQLTPYIVIDAEYPNVKVPLEYVEKGRIVLNVSPSAVRNFMVEKDRVEFQARFAGVPHFVFVPVKGIEAIYAKENGRGMVFKDDEDDDDQPPPSIESSSSASKDDKKGKKGKPNLTIVK